MRPDQASRTAAMVAACRGFAAYLPSDAQLAVDPFGVRFGGPYAERLDALCALALALLVCAACESPAAPAPRAAQGKLQPAAAVTTKPTAVAPAPEPVHFGAAFSGAPVLEFAELLAHPERAPEHPVQVRGEVRQACTRRGCWLELATALSEDAPGCRVVLKDHAFFVPIDSAGSRARVEGVVHKQTVSAAQVAHMESEGGRFSNKQPDGSALELRIVASGVELTRTR